MILHKVLDNSTLPIQWRDSYQNFIWHKNNAFADSKKLTTFLSERIDIFESITVFSIYKIDYNKRFIFKDVIELIAGSELIDSINSPDFFTFEKNRYFYSPSEDIVNLGNGLYFAYVQTSNYQFITLPFCIAEGVSLVQFINVLSLNDNEFYSYDNENPIIYA